MAGVRLQRPLLLKQKLTLEKRPKEGPRVSTQVPEGRVFQAEGAVRFQVLRRDLPWEFEGPK